MATLTSSLIVRVLDQASAPARAIARNLLGINKAAEQAGRGGFGDSLNAAISANNRALDRARGQMVDTIASVYALRTALGAPIDAAMKFESAMADIAKVSGFDDKGLDLYGKRLRKLAVTEIPLAVNDLAALSAAAAQAGVPDADLFDFTRLTAKAAVAWEMSGAEAGEALAKIRTALGLTTDQTSAYADAVNYVSDSTAASSRDLIDFTKRVASQGEFFGFAKEQTLAFGAAMISAGAESEVAATSFRNMGRALTRGASATKAQRGAWKRLGMDAVKVAKAMQKDAVGTTVKVIEKLGELPEHMQASVMSDLFGDEARALAPLLNNTELLRKALALTADEQKYLNSVGRKFEKRAATSEYKLQRFKSQLADIGLTVGASLLPALNKLLVPMGEMALKLSDWAEAHPELIRNVIAATAAVIGFRAAVVSLKWLGLIGRGGALSMLALGFNTVGRAAIGAAAGVSGAMRGLRYLFVADAARSVAIQSAASAKALVDQSRAAYAGALGMRELAKGGAIAGLSLKDAKVAVAATGREAVSAQLALAAANTQLRATGPAARLATVGIGVAQAAVSALKIAVISTGIGAALVAIGTAGVWIYNNWRGIEQMFVGMAGAIKERFPALGPIFDTVSNAVSGLFDWFSKLTGPIGATEAEWRAFGVSIVEGVVELGTAFTMLPIVFFDAGTRAIQAMWSGMKEGFGDLLAWARDIPSQIKEAVGSFDFFGWGSTAPVQLPATGNVQDLRRALDIAKELAAQRQANGATGVELSGDDAKRLEQLEESYRSAVAGLPQTAQADMDAYVSAIADGGDEASAEAARIASRIVQSLSLTVTPVVDTSSITGALSDVQRLENALRSAGGAAVKWVTHNPKSSPTPIAGARARGGPVSAGESYLVGEEGPELFRPDRSGTIVPADETERIVGRVPTVGHDDQKRAVGREPVGKPAVPVPDELGRTDPVTLPTPPARSDRSEYGGERAGGRDEMAALLSELRSFSMEERTLARAPSVPAQAPNVTINPVVNVKINGVQDIRAALHDVESEMARMVREVLGQEMRELLRGVHADAGVLG